MLSRLIKPHIPCWETAGVIFIFQSDKLSHPQNLAHIQPAELDYIGERNTSAPWCWLTLRSGSYGTDVTGKLPIHFILKFISTDAFLLVRFKVHTAQWKDNSLPSISSQ